MKHKIQKSQGFTLIELLVVVAIIGLLASVVLVAMASARQKSRDAKRLGDMTQMLNGLELYFATNKGYPSATNGVPLDLKPQFASTLPEAPLPADGSCAVLTYPNGQPANTYYYVPSGQFYIINGKTVYSDFAYYFCLGRQTGNFDAGIHYVTPTGIK